MDQEFRKVALTILFFGIRFDSIIVFSTSYFIGSDMLPLKHLSELNTGKEH